MLNNVTSKASFKERHELSFFTHRLNDKKVPYQRR